MSSKKNVRLAVLSLIGLLGLTACGNTASSDEIYSKPGNYNDPIVTINGDSDIHHDLMKIVYDEMHEGSLATKTVDKLMYRYAESIFGVYNRVTKKAGSTEITLKRAWEDASLYAESVEAHELDNNVAIHDPVDAKAFVKLHKSYWNYNEAGKHVTDEGVEIPEGEDWVPGATEIRHVISKYEAVELRIEENMYKRVKSSGKIDEKHYWSEEDYLKSLYFDNYKVGYKETGRPEIEKVIIPYTVEAEDVFDEFETGKRVLTRGYYQSSVDINETVENPTIKNTFVEDIIIPEVYADLLVEQYLLDQDVAAIRNSRARKINVIKIEKYSGASGNADKLAQKLIEEIYQDVPAATDTSVRTDADVIEDLVEARFKKYATINKGLYKDIDGVTEYETIVNELNGQANYIYKKNSVVINHDPGTTADDETIWYYENTSYADLVKKYAKVANTTDWSLLDSAEYTTFTNSGARSIEEGFAQQLIDIKQKETITKGWYIQNNAPSFDSEGIIKDRLFKLSVANAKLEIGEGKDEQQIENNKTKLKDLDRIQKEGATWERRATQDPEENKFLCSINGAYYLKFEDQYSGDDWWKDILLDTTDAYYVVQVTEAVKDVKLRNLSTQNYVATRGQEFMDKATDQVAKLVGETGNYSSLAKTYYLKKMDLSFHDQKVYDYFYDSYPELF